MAEVEEFMKVHDDGPATLNWLEKYAPDYRNIVCSTFLLLKYEVKFWESKIHGCVVEE